MPQAQTCGMDGLRVLRVGTSPRGGSRTTFRDSPRQRASRISRPVPQVHRRGGLAKLRISGVETARSEVALGRPMRREQCGVGRRMKIDIARRKLSSPCRRCLLDRSAARSTRRAQGSDRSISKCSGESHWDRVPDLSGLLEERVAEELVFVCNSLKGRRLSQRDAPVLLRMYESSTVHIDAPGS